MLEIVCAKNEEVVVIMILLVVVPPMVMFIDYLFKKDELLDWYYSWLCKKWDYWTLKKSWKRKLLKPIGLCPACMQVWVSFLYMIIFSVNYKYLLIIIPLNYLFLRVLYKWFEDGK